MNKNKAIELIEKLSNANGASGFEEEVVKITKHETKHIGKQETDAIKNLYVYKKENTDNHPVLQLDAHSDEVSFMIQAVREDGLLRFVTLGGWVPYNVTAQKVRVRNREGKYINGIVTSKPPHFMSSEEKNIVPKIDDLFIDVGASCQQDIESKYKIDIGSPVVPAVVCEYNEDTNIFMGKAFDCRIGVACMIDVLDELQSDNIYPNVVATLTSQEEVGERGAMVAAQKVQADISIVFEGCPADDTAVESYMIQSAMGKGPMLRNYDCSMITNPEFQNYAVNIAQQNNIPIQLSVRQGGGTNGSVINTVKGAPTIVIGIPVRYAHTHHCFVNLEDYNHAKELALQIIKSLTNEKISQLLKPVE